MMIGDVKMINRSFALLLLLVSFASAACSDAAATGDLTDATVQTLVSTNFLNAGETFKVTCIVINKHGKKVPADTTFAVDPGKGVIVQGTELTPQLPGEYAVACRIAGEGIVDKTPETVIVTMDNIASIETVLDKNKVTAGEKVVGVCQVRDIDGEWVGWETELLVDPPFGIEVDDHTISTIMMGKYDVACRALGLPIVDKTPELLTVSAGDAQTVRATIKEEVVEAGTVVPVLCTIEDSMGNVLEHQSVIDPQEGIEVQGSSILAKVAGEYDVTCSAAEEEELGSLEKIPDHLTVLGGEPMVLTLKPKPKKDAYKVEDMVAILVSVEDEHGNLLEDFVEEVILTAPEEMDVTEGGKYVFPFEGTFTFTGELPAPFDHLSDELTLYCDDTGPTIVVFKPERAATLTGEQMVSVEGNVVDNVSSVVELDINGISVPVDAEGNFFHVVEAAHGMNILTLAGFDGFGNDAKVVQSFYYSTGYVDYSSEEIQNVILEEALLVFLGQNFLDDGDHDKANVDDLATLLEILLDNVVDLVIPGDGIPLIDTVIPDLLNYSLGVAGFGVTITGDLEIAVHLETITLAAPYVSIDTREGGIDLAISFPGTDENPGVYVQLLLELGFDLTLDVNLGPGLEYEIFMAPFTTVESSVSVETLVVSTKLDMDKNPGEDLALSIGELKVEPIGIHVSPLQDLAIELGPVEVNGVEVFDLGSVPLGQLIQNFDAFLSDFIIDPVLNFLIPMVTDLLQPIIESQVSPMIEDLLNQFELELPIPLPALPGSPGDVTITFKTALSSVHFSDTGGELGLLAGFMAPKGVDREILGSILRMGCMGGPQVPPEFDSSEKMSLAAALDMVNELLFSIWWGGGLALTLDDSVLGGLSLDGFGVSNLNVSTTFLLPPILDDCTAKGMVELQVGDLLVDLSLTVLIAPVKISMYVSAALDATIYGQGNEIGLEVLGVTELGTQIMKIEGNLGPLAGMLDIEELIDNVLVPMILEQVSNLSLGSFPLPEIDLSALLPGIPPGTTLSLTNLEIGMKSGYLLFGGELQ